MRAPNKVEEKTTISIGQKPSQFRKRLLDEPPEGKEFDWGYTDYACYDDVQKWFKKIAEEFIPQGKQEELD